MIHNVEWNQHSNDVADVDSRSKWRLVQFVVISGGGWLLDLSLMSWLVYRHISPVTANAISAATALLCVFTISQSRVFEHDGTRLWAKLGTYAAYNVMAVLAASVAVGVIASALLYAHQHFGDMIVPSHLSIDVSVAAAILAKIIVTPITLYSNFVFMTWLLEGRLAFR